MILFHSETNFTLTDQETYSSWISSAVSEMQKEVGAINYIFCDDAYLLKINQKHLKHNTLTDIISFDYSENDKLAGDIYISTERVAENAAKYKVSFANELQRVLIHGILHFVGFNDKTKEEKIEMREQENYYLALLSF
jgi:rRNA maturation RNase YbeY